MKLNIDYSQLDRYAARMREAAAGSAREMMKGLLAETADRVTGETKRNTPVATGALRAAWNAGGVGESGGYLKAAISNGMEYATHVERGHRTRNGKWVQGRHMLRNAMEAAQRGIQRDFDARLAKWAKEEGLAT